MPETDDSQKSEIELLVPPRERDLGDGFFVRRMLPYAKRRMAGPWVFFDHFGPMSVPPGEGMDVRPHPHINLATVSYLFEGEIFHRDSVGTALSITPGAINLMTAGRGIVHSERTSPEVRAKGHRSHGLQLWLALPEDQEEIEPAFDHYPADTIPEVTRDGVVIRVMMGAAFGVTSPVKTYSPTLYFEARMDAGAGLALPDDAQEIAVYVVTGGISVGGAPVQENELAFVKPGSAIVAGPETQIAVIGGAPLGERHIWWNFVSSRKERLEQAKADWREGRFPKVPGDEDEFIPLPEG